ncbi:hypothetical protein [Silvanigrella aquatica]|uniref:Uncharacterized protein n=1 Tax=Silvanigrella aquatica TaxID=1915309 RepID=A0A1L4D1L1_9BACT|nr:hypothetical protein [Silvanigrella aquatica]APJ04093.1 hypothetical protein AXG55_09305 [Silvanigrella aquatica]
MKSKHSSSILKLSTFGFLLANLSFLNILETSKIYGEEENLEQKTSATSEIKDGSNVNSKSSGASLLIGAKGRFGKGAVFKCNLDGKNCEEFLGGNKKFDDPSDVHYKQVTLYQADNFGSGIAVSKSNIYIGSMGRNNKKAADAGSISAANFKEDIGAIFKCNLNGKDCFEFIGGQVGFNKNEEKNIDLYPTDNFGSSLIVMKDRMYVGCMGRDSKTKDELGAIFECGLSEKFCSEIFAGKNKFSEKNNMFKENDAIGSSIFATKNHLFIGAFHKNEGNGRLLKCDLSFKKCEIIDALYLKLITNDSFGASITGNASNIFVGALGRNGIPRTDPALFDIGTVFKCSIEGTNCVEIVGGENKESVTALALSVNDYLGSSVTLTDDYLFIGAMGRKNISGERTGAVYRCDLNGKNCVELLGGKNKDSLSADGITLYDGDQFGSSLAVIPE